MISAGDYVAYLAAKKTVDDRALNRYVRQQLRAALRPSTPADPLRVIEFGAGIGTMYDRVMEWDMASPLHYALVDINPDYLDAFRSRHAAERNEHPHPPDAWVEILCADLYDVIADPRQQGQWDLIIAHAVMDLVDASRVLAGFSRLVKPGGLLYLSLIYDGHTEFLPSDDTKFERELLHRYHLSMDRRELRSSRTGTGRAARDMFGRFAAPGLLLLAAGSSDWIVFPQAGRYLKDEAFFLDMIIDTIERQLRQDPAMNPGRLAAWAVRRHAMVEAGELIYRARNVDFLVCRPPL